MTDSLAKRLASREATVGVIGLGYVGLPLAISFAEVGYKVFGFDVSDDVVTGLNTGRSHIDDVTPARVAPLVASSAFRATSNVTDIVECDAVFICVDRKSTRLNSSHVSESRMPSSA